ncbi:MAG: hypothetical protein K2R93_15755 [Gemmatimonadaceae bacterium]|nr:hypothetical protein [Gemmatimonadaceae bacterium]
MSTSPPRRPSTLAARQFEAAQRGIGAAPPAGRREAGPMMGVGRSSVANAPAVPARLVPSVPMRTRPVAPVPTPYATTVRGAAKPVAERPAETPAGPTRETQRRIAAAERERTLVTSLIVAFVFVAVSIAAVQMRGSMQLDRSKQAMSATFVKVFELQGTYRLLNGRFATWRELEGRGARLGPDQRVVKSNASSSHWFLSLRDTGTGIICSRTGELFDDNPLNRNPSCSTP